MVLGGTGSVEGTTCWYLEELGQYEAVLGGKWLYWVSMRQLRLVLDCIWLAEGGTGCYLVVLGQYKVVLVGTW